MVAWLERVIHLVPVGQRPPGYGPLGVKQPGPGWIARLGASGRACYDAIVAMDLAALGESLNECSRAWDAILPQVYEHPTITIDLRGLLAAYAADYAGRHDLRAAAAATSSSPPTTRRPALRASRCAHERGVEVPRADGPRRRGPSRRGRGDPGQPAIGRRALPRGGGPRRAAPRPDPSDTLVTERTGVAPAVPGRRAAVPRRVDPLGDERRGRGPSVADAPAALDAIAAPPLPRRTRGGGRPASGRPRPAAGVPLRGRHTARPEPDFRSDPARARPRHAAGRRHRLLRLAPLRAHPLLHGRGGLRRALRRRRQRPQRRAAQGRRAPAAARGGAAVHGRRRAQRPPVPGLVRIRLDGRRARDRRHPADPLRRERGRRRAREARLLRGRTASSTSCCERVPHAGLPARPARASAASSPLPSPFGRCGRTGFVHAIADAFRPAQVRATGHADPPRRRQARGRLADDRVARRQRFRPRSARSCRSARRAGAGGDRLHAQHGGPQPPRRGDRHHRARCCRT